MIIGSLELVEIDYLCKMFGITRRSGFKWLTTLQITILHIADKAYFSTEALEVTLRVIVETGETFSMPGCNRKQSPSRYIGLTKLPSKMKKRVCEVQTQSTNNFNKEAKSWQKQEQELKEAKKALAKLRKTIRDQKPGRRS